MNTKPFESWKVVLNCAICGACPAVEVNAEDVTIGEDNTLCVSRTRSGMTLSHASRKAS